MTADDAAVAARCPAVVGAAVGLRGCGKTTGAPGRDWQVATVVGTTPEYLAVVDWRPADGRAFTAEEARNGDAVCLVGQTAAAGLFGDGPPVGREIHARDHPFRVVGVLARRGRDTMGVDQDDTILAPMTAVAPLRNRPGDGKPSFIFLKVRGDVAAAVRQVEQVMREQHGIGPAGQDDFVVVDRTE